MREMKDSGVDWIGKIPAKWTIIKFSSFIERMGTGLNPRDNFVLDKDSPYYYVTIRNFKNGRLYLDENCDRISQEAFDIIQERSQLQVGDFLFASISKESQVYLIKEAPSNWNINESVFCIRPKKDVYHLGFLYYQLIDYRFYESLLADATGSTFLSIKQNKLKQSTLVLPTVDEQKSISAYLERKCPRIDALVANAEQQIVKLKAYKQSVITEAVTKGLDHNAEMKDSGVEWIGEIPKHWKVTKTKYVFQSGNGSLRIGPFGSALSGKTLDDGEYKIYNQSHLVSNDFSMNRHFVSSETFQELSSYEVIPDDILFSMMGTGTIGKCRIMPIGYPRGIMDSHLLKARLNDKILPKFFEYVYDKDLSTIVIKQLLYLQNGSIMTGLNSSIVKNLFISLPPIDEQRVIVDYLDRKCFQIDCLIAIKQQKIEKLQQYKKSLIYEYVTGKKEVI